MMSDADRIVEATMPYTLRPKRGNREKVIAATLEFIIAEYQYNDYGLIDVEDIKNLIKELKEPETLEELSTRSTRTDLDAL